MPTILILYPEAFKAYSKFQRKVRKILANISDVVVVFERDPNEFIKKFAEESAVGYRAVERFDLSEITHAVIFDDGEEFVTQVEEIREAKIPVRYITIRITRVVNIKKEPLCQAQRSGPSYEYIGRGSYWGNPYSMFEDGEDREEVIRKYQYDFDYEKFPNKDKSEVFKLAGKRLGCFCKPLPCHGDVLADFLNSWDDGS